MSTKSVCSNQLSSEYPRPDSVDDGYATGIYKNFTRGLMSDALCDEVDLSQFCQHVSLL